jgi:hypothetical protein
MKNTKGDITPKQSIYICSVLLAGSLFLIVTLVSIHDKDTGDKDWFGLFLSIAIFLLSFAGLVSACKDYKNSVKEQQKIL